jgi:hypothetical protein
MTHDWISTLRYLVKNEKADSFHVHALERIDELTAENSLLRSALKRIEDMECTCLTRTYCNCRINMQEIALWALEDASSKTPARASDPKGGT